MFPTFRLIVARRRLVSLVVVFVFATGCESNSGNAQRTSANASRLVPADSMLCFKTSMQHPSGPFHFSYRKSSTGQSAADWEADVTPDKIEGFAKTGIVTDKIHGERSDERGWNTAVLTLIEPLPDRIFDMARSATKEEGPERVNGYQTVKYLVDTSDLLTRQEKSRYISVTGAKDYNVTGDVWITQDTGCMVKFVIDYEQNFEDGRVEKTHYDGSMKKR